MSATAPSPDAEAEPEDYQCNYCGGTAPAHEFVSEACCSPECERADLAERLLKTISHDHTVCGTCYRRTKEIQKPGPQHPDVFIGYQFRTRHAGWGEKSPVRDQRSIEDLRLPSLDRQLYAYEAPDGTIETPAENFDHAHDAVGTVPPEIDPRDRRVWTGTVCTCGQTDHRDGDKTLQKADRGGVTFGFLQTLTHYQRSGEADVEIDREAFVERRRYGAALKEAFERSIRI